MNDRVQDGPRSAAPASPASPVGRRGPSGRPVLLLFLALWIAVIIGIYVLIVRLKLGGAESLRTPAPTPRNSAPTP